MGESKHGKDKKKYKVVIGRGKRKLETLASLREQE
jgi:hypothetical protein